MGVGLAKKVDGKAEKAQDTAVDQTTESTKIGNEADSRAAMQKELKQQRQEASSDVANALDDEAKQEAAAEEVVEIFEIQKTLILDSEELTDSQKEKLIELQEELSSAIEEKVITAAEAKAYVADLLQFALLPPEQIAALEAQLDANRVGLLSEAQISKLTPAQIQSLGEKHFDLLNENQLQAFTPAQAALISSEMLDTLTEAQLGAFTDAQKEGNPLLKIACMTDQEVGSAIADMPVEQISLLRKHHLQALTEEQTAGLSDVKLQALTDRNMNLARLSQRQEIVESSVSDFQKQQLLDYQDQQMNLVNEEQQGFQEALDAVGKLMYFSTLTADEIVLIDAVKVSEFDTAQIQILSREQLSALTADQITALTTDHIQILQPDQLLALNTTQIQALTPEQVAALGFQQVDCLANEQIVAFTVEQRKVNELVAVASLTPEEIKNLDATTLSDAQLQIMRRQHIDSLTVKQLSDLSEHQQEVLNVRDQELLAAEARAKTFASLDQEIRTGPFTEEQKEKLLRIAADLYEEVTEHDTAIDKIDKISLDFAALHLRNTMAIAGALPEELSQISPEGIHDLNRDMIWILTGEQIAALNGEQVAALTPDHIKALEASHIKALSTEQISNFSIEHINALTFEQVGMFSEAQIQDSKTLQLLAVPLDKFTELNLEALSKEELQVLRLEHLERMSIDQINSLSEEQLEVLSEEQLKCNPLLAVASLSGSDIATVPPELIAEGGTDLIQVLRESHIEALTSEQIAILTPEQIKIFTSEQVSVLDIEQVNAVPAEKLGHFLAEQKEANKLLEAACWTAEEFKDIVISDVSEEQIQVLRDFHIAALTKEQLKGLDSKQIQVLSEEQMRALTPERAAELSIDQVNSFLDTQLGYFTEKQQEASALLQIACLSASEFKEFPVDKLTVEQIQVLREAHMRALKKGIEKLSEEQLQTFNPEQLSYLTTRQINAFTATQLTQFKDDQISQNNLLALASLRPDEFAKLDPQAIAELNPEQIRVLREGHMAAMTSEQIAELQPKHLRALKKGQVQALGENIVHLTPEHLDSMREKIMYLTKEQVGKLTGDQASELSPAQQNLLLAHDGALDFVSNNISHVDERLLIKWDGLKDVKPEVLKTLIDTKGVSDEFIGAWTAEQIAGEVDKKTGKRVGGVFTAEELAGMKGERLLRTANDQDKYDAVLGKLKEELGAKRSAKFEALLRAAKAEASGKTVEDTKISDMELSDDPVVATKDKLDLLSDEVARLHRLLKIDTKASGLQSAGIGDFEKVENLLKTASKEHLILIKETYQLHYGKEGVENQLEKDIKDVTWNRVPWGDKQDVLLKLIDETQVDEDKIEEKEKKAWQSLDKGEFKEWKKEQALVSQLAKAIEAKDFEKVEKYLSGSPDKVMRLKLSYDKYHDLTDDITNAFKDKQQETLLKLEPKLPGSDAAIKLRALIKEYVKGDMIGLTTFPNAREKAEVLKDIKAELKGKTPEEIQQIREAYGDMWYGQTLDQGLEARLGKQAAETDKLLYTDDAYLTAGTLYRALKEKGKSWKDVIDAHLPEGEREMNRKIVTAYEDRYGERLKDRLKKDLKGKEGLFIALTEPHYKALQAYLADRVDPDSGVKDGALFLHDQIIEHILEKERAASKNWASDELPADVAEKYFKDEDGILDSILHLDLINGEVTYTWDQLETRIMTLPLNELLRFLDEEDYKKITKKIIEAEATEEAEVLQREKYLDMDVEDSELTSGEAATIVRTNAHRNLTASKLETKAVVGALREMGQRVDSFHTEFQDSVPGIWEFQEHMEDAQTYEGWRVEAQWRGISDFSETPGNPIEDRIPRSFLEGIPGSDYRFEEDLANDWGTTDGYSEDFIGSYHDREFHMDSEGYIVDEDGDFADADLAMAEDAEFLAFVRENSAAYLVNGSPLIKINGSVDTDQEKKNLAELNERVTEWNGLKTELKEFFEQHGEKWEATDYPVRQRKQIQVLLERREALHKEILELEGEFKLTAKSDPAGFATPKTSEPTVEVEWQAGATPDPANTVEYLSGLYKTEMDREFHLDSEGYVVDEDGRYADPDRAMKEDPEFFAQVQEKSTAYITEGKPVIQLVSAVRIFQEQEAFDKLEARIEDWERLLQEFEDYFNEHGMQKEVTDYSVEQRKEMQLLLERREALHKEILALEESFRFYANSDLAGFVIQVGENPDGTPIKERKRFAPRVRLNWGNDERADAANEVEYINGLYKTVADRDNGLDADTILEVKEPPQDPPVDPTATTKRDPVSDPVASVTKESNRASMDPNLVDTSTTTTASNVNVAEPVVDKAVALEDEAEPTLSRDEDLKVSEAADLKNSTELAQKLAPLNDKKEKLRPTSKVSLVDEEKIITFNSAPERWVDLDSSEIRLTDASKFSQPININFGANLGSEIKPEISRANLGEAFRRMEPQDEVQFTLQQNDITNFADEKFGEDVHKAAQEIFKNNAGWAILHSQYADTDSSRIAVLNPEVMVDLKLNYIMSEQELTGLYERLYVAGVREKLIDGYIAAQENIEGDPVTREGIDSTLQGTEMAIAMLFVAYHKGDLNRSVFESAIDQFNKDLQNNTGIRDAFSKQGLLEPADRQMFDGISVDGRVIIIDRSGNEKPTLHNFHIAA